MNPVSSSKDNGEPTEREWLEGERYEDKFPETRRVIDCPRCEKGTVKHSPNQNPMWWEVQHLRCSWCRGTGKVYAEAPDGEA